MTTEQLDLTNKGLVDRLKESGVFHSDAVQQVMLKVDRADFCPTDPYVDSPQQLGYGATISAPHMHAEALEELLSVIKPNSHILDVGSGSGYLTACFAQMIGPEGRVVGIEHIDELVELSTQNVRKNNADYLDNGQIKFVAGDGRNGFEPEAPYDAIHVGAAAEEMPKKLIEQLAPGGKMLIPVGSQARGYQDFMAIQRGKDGSVNEQKLGKVVYVPLTEKQLQMDGPQLIKIYKRKE